jgi:integrase
MEREAEGRLRWLTPEEATRLLDACRKSRNAHLTDLVEFALFTGMRRGEVLELTWERVDRARGVVLLDVTKGGKRREVPLNSRADAVLAHRGSKRSGLVFATRRWDHFRTAWENAVERAKLVDFHFYDLRHTFASWAVQRGASLQEVKDLLCHHSLAMTSATGTSRPSTSAPPPPASLQLCPYRKVQRKRASPREHCSRSSRRWWCAWQESNLRPSD